MDRKKIILFVGLLLFVGLIVGGTFAYWTWNSTENKSVVFNTVGNVSDYIVYDEGSSYFIGDFKPTNSYCESVNTTVSFYKTEDANEIALRATINMDVNSIGANIANSSDVYWVVTKGDSNIDCSEGLSSDIVLGSGTFYGKTAGETVKLVTDLEVTKEVFGNSEPSVSISPTNEQKYTVWIWINSDGTDLSKLSGETVDTNIWSQIDMVDPDEGNDIENNDNIYTITYNVNGGMNGPVNQDVEIGQSATISSVVPTRTGYTFSGWNTIANGSGTSYSAGTTYNQSKDLLLYAVWTSNTYTISYVSDDGTSGATDSTNCSYGKSCTLSNNGFVKTGYTFVGWTDSETGTEVVYEDGATILLFDKTSNMTLYALWKINTYVISYDANFGMGEPVDQTKIYGETLTLSSVVPTRDKYKFVEWNTESDGSGTSYQPGDSFDIEQIVTLYAIWEFNILSCSVTAVGGTYTGTALALVTASDCQGTVYYSTSTELDSSNYLTSGSTTIPTGVPDSGEISKTFTVYWYAPENYNVTSGNVSSTVTRESYTVNYDMCSGSDGPSAQTKYYGMTLTLSSTKPIRSGYTFVGWSTAASGGCNATTATYSSGGSYTNNANVTLYAIWRFISGENKVTIYYNVNGGIVTPNATYNWTTDANGRIFGNGSVVKNIVEIGSTVNLNNVSVGSAMEVLKTGETTISGAEWICLSGCTTANKTFNQDTLYSATDFCDISNADCEVEIGVNWTEIFND